MHFNSSFYISLASIFSSSSSVAMRETLQKKGTVNGYLSFYFFISCIVSFFLNALVPVIHPISLPMITLGGITGILMIGLMQSMGKAMQAGSTGMTLAFMNSGSVLASLILGLLFKEELGFPLTVTNLTGMSLIITGLIWGAKSDKNEKISKQWLAFAFLCFVIQAIILTIFQYRNLLIQTDLPSHHLLLVHLDPFEDKWFIPSLFFSAWLTQYLVFQAKERRGFTRFELLGGGIGGIANGFSTFFLLLSVHFATPKQKMMLFPIFTVFVILLGCLYSRYYLKEPIRWSSIGLCGLGVIIGSI